jgi:flagellar biosynthesis/type III secretory pathway protein FliH
VIKANAVRWSAEAWRPAAALNAVADATMAAALTPGIRPAPGHPLASTSETLNLETAREAMMASIIAESHKLLEEARQQARQIVQQAQAQADEVTRQAQEAGRRQAEAEVETLLATAQGVLDEVRAWRASTLAAAETDVLELVTAVARLILGEGVALETSALQAAFARALAEAKPLGNLHVHLHPEDAERLGPHWPRQAPSGQALELVADPTIRRGGCLIEGDHGTVDARLETQLQVALEALSAAAGNGTSTP